MEKITKRHDIALRTLVTLKKSIDKLKKESLSKDDYQMIRDSVIQRFEYSIDTFWKFLKLYLQEQLNTTLESVSPRAILHQALEANLLSIHEHEIAIKAMLDRNETSHSYNEDLAEKIVNDIPKFYETMHAIIKRIKLD